MRNRFLVFLLLCHLLCSCGKESTPMPQDQKSLFNWKEVAAYPTENQCIYISATMVGAVENIRSFSLELEPMTIENSEYDLEELKDEKAICEDCPFTPREVSKITPERAIYSSNKNKGQYFFVYCPKQKSKVYRWRLVISNIFPTFPYVLTPVTTLKTLTP